MAADAAIAAGITIQAAQRAIGMDLSSPALGHLHRLAAAGRTVIARRAGLVVRSRVLLPPARISDW